MSEIKLVKCPQCQIIVKKNKKCSECNALLINSDKITFKKDNIVVLSYFIEDEELKQWCHDTIWGDDLNDEFEITEVDVEAKLIWIKNCPFAISMNDIFTISDKKEKAHNNKIIAKKKKTKFNKQ